MKILAADDDRIALRMLEAMLRSVGHDVVLARDGDEAAQMLDGDPPPRLAILDWNMPGRDGVELCRWLRGREGAPYVYIILLTSRCDSGDRVAGLDSGADDFVVKPFHRAELEARVRTGIRLLTIQAELEAAHERLRTQAAHDALTALLNRGAVLSHLERDLARAARGGGPVAVVLADIDFFKSVNDRFGHPAGDAVLRETARRMRSVLRAGDAIGRYGGEEFLIVLSPSNGEQAAKIAERIRLSVCGTPVALESVQLDLTCSFGVAASRPGDPATAAALIEAADEALYRAKRGGRNRVEHAPDGASTDVASLVVGAA